MENQKARPNENGPTDKTMKGKDHKVQGSGGQRPCWDSQAWLFPLLHVREMTVLRGTKFFVFAARLTRRRELATIIP